MRPRVQQGTPPGALRAVRDLALKYLVEIGGIPLTRITDHARFDQELEMKSIAFVELQVALEDQLDIEIDPLRVLELNRLDKVIDYLHSLVLSRNPHPNGT